MPLRYLTDKQMNSQNNKQKNIRIKRNLLILYLNWANPSNNNRQQWNSMFWFHIILLSGIQKPQYQNNPQLEVLNVAVNCCCIQSRCFIVQQMLSNITQTYYNSHKRCPISDMFLVPLGAPMRDPLNPPKSLRWDKPFTFLLFFHLYWNIQ